MPSKIADSPDEIVNGVRIHEQARETKRVYCLGPGGSRINFLSQQVRALNVVWALFQTNEFGANDKVAVVGAGLAGVTAAIALRAHGASVHLYDRLDSPLARQLGATHREVYPDINFWPEASPPNPTTSLPFLNWHFGRCDMIAQDLIDDWNEISKAHPYDLSFEQQEITDIDPVEFDENRLKLTFTGGGSENGYRLVIIACGYGEDNPHDEFDAHDYWAPDALENLTLKNGNVSDIFVSGAGDGGQIDALRASLKFRQGRLAFSLAKSLAGTSVEAKFKWSAGRPSKDAYEEDAYADAAKAILEDLDNGLSEAKKIITQAFDRNTPKQVHLVQLDGSPYQTEAAIIHKLLVKLAAGKGHLKVWSDSHLARNDDQSNILVKSTGSGKVRERERADECHVIIRHGAKDNFASILDDDEVSRVRESHSTLKFTDYKPKWTGDYPTPKGVTCSVKDRAKFIVEVHERAQKALVSFGVGGATLMKAHDCFLIDGVDEGQVWPSELYGIPLRPAPTDEVYDAID